MFFLLWGYTAYPIHKLNKFFLKQIPDTGDYVLFFDFGSENRDLVETVMIPIEIINDDPDSYLREFAFELRYVNGESVNIDDLNEIVVKKLST